MDVLKRKMVYIAHPMAGRSGDIKENFKNNMDNIRKICDHMTENIFSEEAENQSCLPDNEFTKLTPWFFAPQLYISQFVNESKVDKEYFNITRGIAIEFCLAFVDRVDEIHVYKPEELSRGVMDDIERASRNGTPVVFKERYPWQK